MVMTEEGCAMEGNTSSNTEYAEILWPILYMILCACTSVVSFFCF